jgi:hypothetical protein
MALKVVEPVKQVKQKRHSEDYWNPKRTLARSRIKLALEALLSEEGFAPEKIPGLVERFRELLGKTTENRGRAVAVTATPAELTAFRAYELSGDWEAFTAAYRQIHRKPSSSHLNFGFARISRAAALAKRRKGKE